jgi:hypothetical protein
MFFFLLNFVINYQVLKNKRKQNSFLDNVLLLAFFF